jgi:hypothetical protein
MRWPRRRVRSVSSSWSSPGRRWQVAAGRPVEQADQVEQGALAGAGGADQGGELAALQLQVDAVQDFDFQRRRRCRRICGHRPGARTVSPSATDGHHGVEARRGGPGCRRPAMPTRVAPAADQDQAGFDGDDEHRRAVRVARQRCHSMQNSSRPAPSRAANRKGRRCRPAAGRCAASGRASRPSPAGCRFPCRAG